jgi:hypothetical protein
VVSQTLPAAFVIGKTLSRAERLEIMVVAGEAELTSADATTLHDVPPHLREGQSGRALTGLPLSRSDRSTTHG